MQITQTKLSSLILKNLLQSYDLAWARARWVEYVCEGINPRFAIEKNKDIKYKWLEFMAILITSESNYHCKKNRFMRSSRDVCWGSEFQRKGTRSWYQPAAAVAWASLLCQRESSVHWEISFRLSDLTSHVHNIYAVWVAISTLQHAVIHAHFHHSHHAAAASSEMGRERFAHKINTRLFHK